MGVFAAAVASAIVLLPSGAAQAQTPKSKTLTLPWAKDAKDAKLQAAAAKKPIAVCFIQKTCRLSQHMVEALHQDGRIYELSGNVVWLCVDPGRAEDFKWFLGECGETVEGTPTIFFLNESGQIGDPNLAGVEPVSGADPDRIVAALRKLLTRYKKDIGEPEKQALLEKKREAGEAAASAPGKALDLYRQVVRGGDGWDSMEEAVQECREAVEKILQEGMEKVRAAIARKAAPEEAAKAFLEIKDAYGDSAVARWAAREAERCKAAGKGK
jgi:hypothetical protein